MTFLELGYTWPFGCYNMSKLKASLIHFAISFLVVLGFILFLYGVWYKNLFFISGVIEPLKLLFLVDVILGPLLTFVVYKHGKKTLKMDLSLIVLMQISAFIYGAYTIYSGKPSWVIYNGSQFEVVYEREVGDQLEHLVKSSLLETPHYGLIQLGNTKINLMAYQNLAEVELLNEQNRNELTYFMMSADEVAATLGMDVDQLPQRIERPMDEVEFYPLSNNGLVSVLVVSKTDLQELQVLAYE